MPEHFSENMIAFYQNDKYSRMCPGKREYVRVRIDGRYQHKQNRPLLVKLKELYLDFTKEMDMSVSFSTCCTLNPTLCVPASSTSSAHSVCV